MPTSWLPFRSEAFFHPRRLRSLRTDGSASMFPSVFGDGAAWGRLYVTLVCATAPAERAAPGGLCCSWKPMFLTDAMGSWLLAVPLAALGGNRVFPPTVWAQPWKMPVVLKFQASENPGFAVVLFLLSEPSYCSVHSSGGCSACQVVCPEVQRTAGWEALTPAFRIIAFLSFSLFFSVCFLSQPHRIHLCHLHALLSSPAFILLVFELVYVEFISMMDLLCFILYSFCNLFGKGPARCYSLHLIFEVPVSLLRCQWWQ